jgi:hypothetical protein
LTFHRLSELFSAQMRIAYGSVYASNSVTNYVPCDRETNTLPIRVWYSKASFCKSSNYSDRTCKKNGVP